MSSHVFAFVQITLEIMFLLFYKLFTNQCKDENSIIFYPTPRLSKVIFSSRQTDGNSAPVGENSAVSLIFSSCLLFSSVSMADTCRPIQNRQRRTMIRVRRSAANHWLPKTDKRRQRRCSAS